MTWPRSAAKNSATPRASERASAEPPHSDGVSTETRVPPERLTGSASSQGTNRSADVSNRPGAPLLDAPLVHTIERAAMPRPLAFATGLTLIAAVSAQDWRFPDPRWWLTRASAGRIDEFMAKQWLVVAEKPVEGAQNGPA